MTVWQRSGNRLVLNVVIPPNTTAAFGIPTKDTDSVTEGGKPVKNTQGLEYLRTENNKLWLKADAGAYKFVSEFDE
jgi:alpha-L-rhamnosidase